MCPINDDIEEIPIYHSIKEFDKNIPNTVEILKTSQLDKVYLIGTAHFSRKSQTDVSLVMRNVRPDGLVLELCPIRLHILQFDEATLLREAQDLNPSKIGQIFKEHGVMNGMFYLSFLRTNARITKELGMAPGGECRRAVKEAKKLPNCKVFLGDRLIDITIQRALSGLNLKQKMLVSMALHSNNKSQKLPITEEDIEKFKKRDSEPLEQMKILTPSVYNSFVTERDYILAHSMTIAIDKCRKENNRSASIVGVIGMGHMIGIINTFGKTNDKKIKELMKIPKKTNDGRSGTAFHSTSINLVTWNNNINKSLKVFFNLKKLWRKFKK